MGALSPCTISTGAIAARMGGSVGRDSSAAIGHARTQATTVSSTPIPRLAANAARTCSSLTDSGWISASGRP